MSECDSRCHHIGPSNGWPHETRLEEDRGEIHTDDCGFFSERAVESGRDPGDFCTAGFPGVACRVFSRAKDLPQPVRPKAKRARSKKEGSRG